MSFTICPLQQILLGYSYQGGWDWSRGMGAMRNAYNILVGKSEGKRTLGTPGTGLANLFESACPNFRQFSEKFFRVPMGILSSKMRSWSFSSSLLIIIRYYNYYIFILLL
jgi:hypothetical protein